jgi:hypothetical protein
MRRDLHAARPRPIRAGVVYCADALPRTHQHREILFRSAVQRYRRAPCVVKATLTGSCTEFKANAPMTAINTAAIHAMMKLRIPLPHDLMTTGG